MTVINQVAFKGSSVYESQDDERRNTCFIIVTNYIKQASQPYAMLHHGMAHLGWQRVLIWRSGAPGTPPLYTSPNTLMQGTPTGQAPHHARQERNLDDNRGTQEEPQCARGVLAGGIRDPGPVPLGRAPSDAIGHTLARIVAARHDGTSQ